MTPQQALLHLSTTNILARLQIARELTDDPTELETCSRLEFKVRELIVNLFVAGLYPTAEQIKSGVRTTARTS